MGAVLTINYQLSCITHILPVRHRCDFLAVGQKQFPLSSKNAEQGDSSAVISYQESNVLRYVSGYVCHALTARVKSSNHPPKKELILCLGDLTTDEQDEQLSNTADWTKLMDHGGLMHVNDNT